MARRASSKQQGRAKPAKIGFLGATAPKAWSAFVEAFEQRLGQRGWTKGSTVAIDYRWANGQPKQFASIAKSFAGDGVDVIVTSGTAPVVAAKKVTAKIPIVFAAAGDPVGTGLVASLARPGRNVTGLSNGAIKLAGRRLDELRKALPGLKRLAILGNRDSSLIRLEMAEVAKQARKRKIATVVCDVRRPTQIAPAMKRLKGKADALFVCTDPILSHHRSKISTTATNAGLPTMHGFRDHVAAGGLMSYGPDFRDLFAGAADLASKILHGAKPSGLAVKEPKKCELVVNATTAAALGLTIPPAVLRRAEVIH